MTPMFPTMPSHNQTARDAAVLYTYAHAGHPLDDADRAAINRIASRYNDIFDGQYPANITLAELARMVGDMV